MQSITLQTNDSIVSSGDFLGQIQFAASNELDAGASRYIIGRIYSEAEGSFTSSANPASLVFATSANDNIPASGKIKISHEGHILPLLDNAYDLGSPDLRFRDLYVTSEVTSPSGNFDYIFFDTTIGDEDLVQGQMNWNSEAGTVELGLTDDLKIQIGQTVLFRVKNSTGSSLSKGQAVYASGVLGGGQIIQAAKFAADESVDEVRFIGLMTDDLANGEDGYVNHFGHIKNVDLRTSNTVLNPNGETWAVGDILFVDDGAAGGLTKNPPQNDIYVALVLEDGQNGELFVRITDPGHITDLHDVNLSGLVDNNLMVWNSGSDYWEPSTNLTFNGSGLQVDDGHIIIDNINTSDPYIKLTGGSTGFLTHTGSAIIAWDVSSNLVPKRLNFIIDGTINSSPILQITSENKVGINKSDAGYELDVVGSGNFSGDLYVGDNVGIGTASPTSKLHIVQNIASNVALKLEQDNASYESYYEATSQDGGYSRFGIGSNANDYTFFNSDQASYRWYTVSTPLMTLLTSTGRLGIGTTSPEQKLHVNDGNIKVENVTTPTIEFDNGAAVKAKTYYDTTNETFVLKHNSVSGDEQLVLTSGGNVGVGTNSPNAVLHAYGSTPSGTVFNVEGSNGSLFSVVDNLSGVLMSVNNNAGLPVFEVYDDDSIIAGRFAQNDFVIGSGGNVGIGTDSAVTKLDVSGVITATGGDSDEWNEAYDWVAASGGLPYVTGVGTANQVAFFNDTDSITSESNLYWDSTNNRLGIGTSSPANLLELKRAGTGPQLKLTGTSASWDFYSYTDNALYINNSAGTSIGLLSNRNVYIDENLGIGTISPSYKLHVAGDISANANNIYGGGFAVYGDANNKLTKSGNDFTLSAGQTTTDVHLGYYDGGTLNKVLTVDSSEDRVGILNTAPDYTLDVTGSGNFTGDLYAGGNLGVGTTSPSSKLHVMGGARLQGDSTGTTWSDASPTLALKRITDSPFISFHTNVGSRIGYLQFHNTSDSTLSVQINQGLRFRTNNQDRLYIAADGDVGIGTTNPQYTLDVNGTSNLGGNVIVGGNLTVNGTTISTNVDTIEIQDPIITLGLTSGNIVTDDSYDRGVAMVTNDGTAFMGWDNSADKFVMLASGVATNGSGNYDAGIYGNLQIADLTASGATFDGNVGIGITSPSHKVEVDGNVAASGLYIKQANDTYRLIYSNALNDVLFNALHVKASYTVGVNGQRGSTQGMGYTNNDLGLYTLSNERIRITNGGNVGIGDSSPSYKLDVAGTTAITPTAATETLILGRNTGYASVKSTASNELILDSDSAYVSLNHYSSDDVILGYGGGNVGIGTATPSYKLDILGGSTSQATVARIKTAYSSLSNNNYALHVDSSSHTSNMTTAGAMAVDVYGGRAFTINGQGNIGIGTNTPTTLLDVSGVITANGGNSDQWNEAYDFIQASGLDGTGAASGVAFWTDSNTLSNDSALIWDSTNNKLGIGIANNVAGTPLWVYTADATNFTRIESATQQGILFTRSLVNNWLVGRDGNNKFHITYNNAFGTNDRISIDTAGSVGIGTASPTQKLDVRYPAGGGMALLKSTDTTDGLLFGDMAYSTSNDFQGMKHVAMTNANDYMIMSNGTNTYVSSNTTNGNTFIRAGGNSNTSEIRLNSTEVVVNDQSSSSDFRVESNNNANMLFVDGIADRVGIGTGAPATSLHIIKGSTTQTLRVDDYTSGQGLSQLANFTNGNDSDLVVYLNNIGATTKYAMLQSSVSNRNLVLNGTNGGNVGIGTTTPVVKLEVQGAGSGSGIQDGLVRFRSTNASNPPGLMFINSGNTSTYNDLANIQGVIESGNAIGGLRFITRNSDGNNTGVGERVRISAAGNVGIGTASPSNKLHVQGSSDQLRLSDGTLAFAVGYDNNYLRFKNSAGDTHTVINWSNGNVGIGTTSPLAKLHIQGSSYQQGLLIERTDTSSKWGLAGLSSGGFQIWDDNQGNATRFVINSSGDVGIGVDSPTTKLDVAGSGNFSGDVTIDGHLSAATKSFYIDHPTKEGKLQYGSLESPYHGVRLTGRGKIEGGKCVVELPDYISSLVRDDDNVNIQLTNYRHGKTLYVDEINIANNEFTVKCDSWFGNNGHEFFWSFTAVRKDVQELKVEC